MKTRGAYITSIAVTGAMLVNPLFARAQGQTQTRTERNVVITTQGGPIPPDVLINGGPSGAYSYNFVSSEMTFDNKVVKGVPYSAEAVTETIQTLSDGNRIVNRMTAATYRDTEGRTRRDQKLGAIGSFAATGEPPQLTFINDPVASVNYVLDSRTRTATKLTRVPSSRGLPLDALGSASSTTNTMVVSGGMLAGKAAKKIEPVYPDAAKAAGAQGSVMVRITINESGEVESAEAVDGHPLLRQAAVDAARQWRFSPTKLSGTPVKVNGHISFVFTKEGTASSETGNAPKAPFQMAVRNDFFATNGTHKPVTEALGKQTIEGVEAEGTRSTVTIPAGEFGNEQPIKIVSERWYSPQLQTVVMTKRSDPRMGETTYRLTNINRSEPAHSLFEVPADYTIKEGPGSFTQTFRMMKPN